MLYNLYENNEKKTFHIHIHREKLGKGKTPTICYLSVETGIQVLVKENFGLPVLTGLNNDNILLCVEKDKRILKTKERYFTLKQYL